jgi:hypothetical protein
MEPVSRRSFLAVAAAGAAGTAALLRSPAAAGAAEPSDRSSKSHPAGSADATNVVVHVRNSGSGELAIFAGESEVVVKDKALTAAIARAATGKR